MVAVVALAALIGSGTTVYRLNSANRDLSITQRQALAMQQLGTGTNLTAFQVSRIDRRQLFFALYKHAMQQQLVFVQGTTLSSPHADLSNAEGYGATLGIDYRTRATFYGIKELVRKDPHGDVTVENRSMCVAGELYAFAEPEEAWKRDPARNCTDPTAYSYALGDGITPWGLNRTQADSLMTYFEQQNPRVLAVTNLSLIRSDSRQLLRFTVDIKPTKTNLVYKGLIRMRQAFDRTGLDADSHPYLNRCGGFNGKHIILDIDPRTRLPVASQMSNTPQLDLDGRSEKPTSLTPYTSESYEYSFNRKLPTLAEAVSDREWLPMR